MDDEWLGDTLGSMWSINLTNAIARSMEEGLAPFRIIPIHMSILVRCYTGQANTVTGLADFIPIDTATISRHVTNLSRMGLLRRTRLQRDRRVVKLKLTEAALALMPHITQAAREVDELLYSGISEEEKRIFLETAGKILMNAERIQAKEHWKQL